jgi:hypothetical protein
MARLGHEKLHLERDTGRTRLYDLARDPHEQHDLASGAPERVAFLQGALARFLDGAVAGETSGAELSEDELELLRELGYAGEDEGRDQ